MSDYSRSVLFLLCVVNYTLLWWNILPCTADMLREEKTSRVLSPPIVGLPNSRTMQCRSPGRSPVLSLLIMMAVLCLSVATRHVVSFTSPRALVDLLERCSLQFPLFILRSIKMCRLCYLGVSLISKLLTRMLMVCRKCAILCELFLLSTRLSTCLRQESPQPRNIVLRN